MVGLFVHKLVGKKIASNYAGISRSPSLRWICLNYISGSSDTHKHIKANITEKKTIKRFQKEDEKQEG